MHLNKSVLTLTFLLFTATISANAIGYILPFLNFKAYFVVLTEKCEEKYPETVEVLKTRIKEFHIQNDKIIEKYIKLYKTKQNFDESKYEILVRRVNKQFIKRLRLLSDKKLEERCISNEWDNVDLKGFVEEQIRVLNKKET